MIDFKPIILDFQRAVAMHISIWWWEMRMTAQYGMDWCYKDPWERL
jgi:hypothetical protein